MAPLKNHRRQTWFNHKEMDYFERILIFMIIMISILSGLQHELITLPNELRDKLTATLEEKGITVGLSPRKLPRHLREAGIAYRCKLGVGCADILIVSQEILPTESKKLAAVLLFPSIGFFAELRYSSLNSKLRDKIRNILYNLKNHKDT